MLGAFAIGADIFFAMLFIAGIAFGGAIFEPEAFELEIFELEAARDFGVTLFFAIGFFTAARTGFVDFLAGFATARLAGRGSTLRGLAAVLRAGAFFAEVVVRFAGAADRFADFDFVAFAISCFDFLSFKFLPE